MRAKILVHFPFHCKLPSKLVRYRTLLGMVNWRDPKQFFDWMINMLAVEPDYVLHQNILRLLVRMKATSVVEAVAGVYNQLNSQQKMDKQKTLAYLAYFSFYGHERACHAAVGVLKTRGDYAPHEIDTALKVFADQMNIRDIHDKDFVKAYQFYLTQDWFRRLATRLTRDEILYCWSQLHGYGSVEWKQYYLDIVADTHDPQWRGEILREMRFWKKNKYSYSRFVWSDYEQSLHVALAKLGDERDLATILDYYQTLPKDLYSYKNSLRIALLALARHIRSQRKQRAQRKLRFSVRGIFREKSKRRAIQVLEKWLHDDDRLVASALLEALGSSPAPRIDFSFTQQRAQGEGSMLSRRDSYFEFLAVDHAEVVLKHHLDSFLRWFADDGSGTMQDEWHSDCERFLPPLYDPVKHKQVSEQLFAILSEIINREPLLLGLMNVKDLYRSVFALILKNTAPSNQEMIMTVLGMECFSSIDANGSGIELDVWRDRFAAWLVQYGTPTRELHRKLLRLHQEIPFRIEQIETLFFGEGDPEDDSRDEQLAFFREMLSEDNEFAIRRAHAKHLADILKDTDDFSEIISDLAHSNVRARRV